MITQKNINWFLEEPSRLKQKKPFTRGGDLVDQSQNLTNVGLATSVEVRQSSLKMQSISQDTFLEEYDPSLHRIRYNMSIPHISVKVGDKVINIDDMTIKAAYQKVIHAAHVLHLANNPMDFTLCNIKKSNNQNWFNRLVNKIIPPTNEMDDINDRFQEYKELWMLKNMESVKYDVISKQQKVGDVGLLYSYDADKNKMKCKVYSYDDGYIVVPNYDEYGEKIACSICYTADDGNQFIDTYDDTYHYAIRPVQDGEESENGYIITKEAHGFSRCPLLYKRGRVAWEYAESAIEMWELMANINAVALKRFGTFGLIFTGQLDEKSFLRDSCSLIVNLSSDTSNGKQDAKVMEFPEPQKMIDYLEFLKNEISVFSSVSFITPSDIKSTGSGGNGIFLAMKNDLALATQSVSDWAEFTNEMTYLFQEGISLESGQTNKYTDLKIFGKLKPWSMESENTKITNLAIESKWLSKQSIVEKSPDAAPNEMERIYNESLMAQSNTQTQDNNNADGGTAAKAERTSKNNNSSINDPVAKTTTSQQV